MAKVLLVEDDQTMLTLLNTLLEIEGHEVSQLDVFDNVIEDVRGNAPDVILMDVHLHETDGLELLSAIRSDKELHDVKVIMSSGMDFLEESLSKGANGFLLKPYMPDELISRINELVSNKEKNN